jgi:hypothetical protein
VSIDNFKSSVVFVVSSLFVRYSSHIYVGLLSILQVFCRYFDTSVGSLYWACKLSLRKFVQRLLVVVFTDLGGRARPSNHSQYTLCLSWNQKVQTVFARVNHRFLS